MKYCWNLMFTLRDTFKMKFSFHNLYRPSVSQFCFIKIFYFHNHIETLSNFLVYYPIIYRGITVVNFDNTSCWKTYLPFMTRGWWSGSKRKRAIQQIINLFHPVAWTGSRRARADFTFYCDVQHLVTNTFYSVTDGKD